MRMTEAANGVEDPKAGSTLEQRTLRLVEAMARTRPEVVSPDCALVADLGYDSVRLIELTMALERAFGLVIPDPEPIAAAVVVGDVIDVVTTAARAT